MPSAEGRLLNVNDYRLVRWFASVIPLVILLTGCPPLPPPSATSRVVSARTRVKGTQYTIVKGDTLSSIADKHNADWRDILHANPRLMEPRNMTPGRVILIPGAPPVAEPPPAPAKQEEVLHNAGHAGPIAAEEDFIWPLKGKILLQFGRQVPWRANDVNRGLDIGAAEGEIVCAAKSGRVYTFQTVPGFGRVVELQHEDGTLTFYGHLERILVTHGTWVKQGERIGIVGSTGLSSGTELHFRILLNEEWADPITLLPE